MIHHHHHDQGGLLCLTLWTFLVLSLHHFSAAGKPNITSIGVNVIINVALCWLHLHKIIQDYLESSNPKPPNGPMSALYNESALPVMHCSISVRLSPVVSLVRFTVFYIVSCTMFQLQFAMHIFFLCGCIAAIAGGSQKWFWSRIQCQSPPPSIVSTITNAIFSSKI